jgi:tetratricopeptide (TPR) repeat protein
VRLQRYDEAISSFGKALEFFVLNGDYFCSAEQLGNIGSVHRDTENWTASLENYRKALTIFEEVGHNVGIADQCSNIGYVCSRHGESEDAVRYFGTARDLYLKLGESGKADLCYKNLQALEALRKSQG